jgi:hypothetical protein
MSMRQKVTPCLILVVVLVASIVFAIPGPVLDLDQLTANADEIVVGVISSILSQAKKR